jgi:protein-disulfide isomerase
MERLTRRDALATGAVSLAGLAGLAGCTGGASGGNDGSGSDDGSTGGDGSIDADSATPTATSTPTQTPVPGGRVAVGADALGGHEAAQGIEGQPILGDVAAARGVVVAFEDPSCPRCATFERRTARRIRDELVPAGDAALVSRTVPIVYQWGEPAVAALEAVFARDATAFWRLLEFYFIAQSGLSSENVLDRTESYLAEETDLDAAGVLVDVESGASADAIDVDLAAADAAGVRGTPTVFLFRDGEYRTKASGSVSYELVTGALGL